MSGILRYRCFLLISFFTVSTTVFAPEYKEVIYGKPEHVARKGVAWAKQSRIIGMLKNAPRDFTIDIYSHSLGKIVSTEIHHNYLTVYQTSWFAPGTYTMTVKAEGYDPHISLKSFKLEAGSDCFLNLEFGKIAYKKNY